MINKHYELRVNFQIQTEEQKEHISTFTITIAFGCIYSDLNMTQDKAEEGGPSHHI